MVAGLLAVAPAGHAAGRAEPGRAGSGRLAVQTFALPLTRVGKIDLSALAASRPALRTPRRQGAPVSRAAAARDRYRVVDPYLVRRRLTGKPARRPDPALARLSLRNVPGESGFSALGGVQQAAVSGFDLEPPDQGLCAGNGYVMEFINEAISVYTPFGAQVVPPVGAPAAFRSPGLAFSDPRCYFDAATKRWFFQELTIGAVGPAGQVTRQSREFEAVSDSADPTGSYTVYSWDTTDAGTAGCPCFGDFDNLGADNNGIYVTTSELGLVSGADNGVVVYAISKQQLEDGARIGVTPAVFGYRLTTGPFGPPFTVAPASTPPGARFAPDTEYFVESDANALSDHRLAVYALRRTDRLAGFTAPFLYRTVVATRLYSAPVNARQRPGPRPLGTAFQDPIGGLQADFDQAGEPTYARGRIYAELDTGTAAGTDAVQWFILTPALSGGTLSARIAHQGVLAAPNVSLLYPYTAVDAAGAGYLVFALSGPHHYPSPAYVRYGPAGPHGPVIIAAAGAAPDDSFGCYPAFVGPANGGCRWGDYSMGAVMNHRIFMATEMIPQGFRDTLSNWGTFIWSAPPPPAGPAAAAAAVPGWTIETSQNRPAAENQLSGVSCTAASACTAVGLSGPAAPTGQVTLAERWNGHTWKIQKTAAPKGAKESRLTAVSCWSAHGCIAVGTFAGSSDVLRPLAERWNGTSWKVLPAPAPRGGSTTLLQGVSCLAANACLAAGSHFSGKATVPLAEWWNGKSWRLISPAAPAHASFSGFAAVSCSAAKACTAAGSSNAGGSTARPFAERWNGSAWKPQKVPGSSGSLLGISCPSGTSCTAVGTVNPSTSPSVLAEHWNGHAWKAQTAIVPPGSATSFLYSVSCATGTSCTAVGQSTGPVPEPTLAETWNGKHWTIQATPNPAGATDSYLAGVFCVTATTCRAAGAFFSGATKSTLAEGN